MLQWSLRLMCGNILCHTIDARLHMIPCTSAHAPIALDHGERPDTHLHLHVRQLGFKRCSIHRLSPSPRILRQRCLILSNRRFRRHSRRRCRFRSVSGGVGRVSKQQQFAADNDPIIGRQRNLCTLFDACAVAKGVAAAADQHHGACIIAGRRA